MNFAKLTDNLTKRGWAVSTFANKEDAAAYLNQQIDGQTVAFGGSMTLKQMGLYEQLSEHNKVIWHWKTTPGTEDEVRHNAQHAAVYLASVNGVAETGELINIDGNGNRVSAIQYGPQKIYLVIGSNKIAPDYEQALWRVRNIAAPKNAQRQHRNTPCAINADRCYDCNSPERSCRALSVLWCPPHGAEYEIILINEPLGY